MLGPDWRGRVTDLLDWIAAAGYAGIEITSRIIGEFAERPEDFGRELARRGLALAAFAYVSDSGFTDPAAWDVELDGARRAIAFLERFPEPILGLGGASSPSPARAREKLDHAIRFYNHVGALAARAGVTVRLHPNSHHGSLVQTAGEYAYLLDRIDPAHVKFGPDTGHIIRGGQDVLQCLRIHLHRIVQVHFKDVDAAGNWVGLGEGVCNFPAVLALLENAGYAGWVIAEEESEAARRDGVTAITRNRAYLRSLGY
jgi:sugar phosphate isomerase/epimerase